MQMIKLEDPLITNLISFMSLTYKKQQKGGWELMSLSRPISFASLTCCILTSLGQGFISHLYGKARNTFLVLRIN